MWSGLRLGCQHLALGALAIWAAPAVAQDLQLLMVERPGCVYCAQWNAEVAPAYPLTPEGQAAPLLRHYIRDPLPEGVTLVSAPVFTPTFVLLQDGAEIGRIEGYPGADFFWGLLGVMVADAESTAEVQP